MKKQKESRRLTIPSLTISFYIYTRRGRKYWWVPAQLNGIVTFRVFCFLTTNHAGLLQVTNEFLVPRPHPITTTARRGFLSCPADAVVVMVALGEMNCDLSPASLRQMKFSSSSSHSPPQIVSPQIRKMRNEVAVGTRRRKRISFCLAAPSDQFCFSTT